MFESFIDLGLTDFLRLTGQPEGPKDPLTSASPALRTHIYHVPVCFFNPKFWGWNSGSRACSANAFLTELSLQPLALNSSSCCLGMLERQVSVTMATP